MSIWTFSHTSLRWLGFILLGFSLAACSTGPQVGMGSGGAFMRRAPEKIAVAQESVVIAGPPGFCVDLTATRDSKAGAFVLLGSCASIANNAKIAAPRTPGVLTASVSAESGSRIATSVSRLDAFFKSESGRAALARDGQAESVRILATRKRGDAFYIRARDTSRNAVPGISQEYWRGLFNVEGRIVTVSVVGFKNKPMSQTDGLAMLDAFAAKIRSENVSRLRVSTRGAPASRL